MVDSTDIFFVGENFKIYKSSLAIPVSLSFRLEASRQGQKHIVELEIIARFDCKELENNFEAVKNNNDLVRHFLKYVIIKAV